MNRSPDLSTAEYEADRRTPTDRNMSCSLRSVGAPTSLRILLLEDNPDDAELISAALCAGPFEPIITRVVGRDDFAAALGEPVDVILSDHALPQFDAVSALELAKSQGVDVPFIIVSGAISEERAVEAMREGAADFLFKDRMARLAPAVAQAVEDRRLRKEIDDARERHRREIEALVENSPDAILRFDRTGLILYANSTNERFTGLTPDQCIGLQGWDLKVAESGGSHWKKAMDELFARGEPVSFEYEADTPAGHRYLEVRLVPERNEDGSFDTILSIARDVTKRKNDERRLVDSEERWRNLVDYHPDALVVIIGTKIAYANAACGELLGYDGDRELVGRSVYDFISAEQFDMLDQRLSRLAAGYRTAPFEYRMFRMDGAERDVEVHSIPIKYAGRPAVQAILHDVTERREYERKIIEARRHAEDVARLKSSILTNLGHEVRTPLATLLGFSDILRDHVDEAGRELVDHLYDSADRLGVTLSSVLDLARLESGSYLVHATRTNVSTEVAAVVETLKQRAARRSLDVRWSPPASPVIAVVDPDVVRRVTELLFDNAVKFTDAGYVEVGLATDDEYVRIMVSDTGIGIKPDFLPRLFEEFQQESTGLNRHYEGCGIGLAIVKRLLELAGGAITVHTVRGGGSTFEAVLPLRPLDRGHSGAA